MDLTETNLTAILNAVCELARELRNKKDFEKAAQVYDSAALVATNLKSPMKKSMVQGFKEQAAQMRKQIRH